MIKSGERQIELAVEIRIGKTMTCIGIENQEEIIQEHIKKKRLTVPTRDKHNKFTHIVRRNQ